MTLGGVSVVRDREISVRPRHSQVVNPLADLVDPRLRLLRYRPRDGPDRAFDFPTDLSRAPHAQLRGGSRAGEDAAGRRAGSGVPLLLVVRTGWTWTVSWIRRCFERDRLGVRGPRSLIVGKTFLGLRVCQDLEPRRRRPERALCSILWKCLACNKVKHLLGATAA